MRELGLFSLEQAQGILKAIYSPLTGRCGVDTYRLFLGCPGKLWAQLEAWEIYIRIPKGQGGNPARLIKYLNSDPERL